MNTIPHMTYTYDGFFFVGVCFPFFDTRLKGLQGFYFLETSALMVDFKLDFLFM